MNNMTLKETIQWRLDYLRAVRGKLYSIYRNSLFGDKKEIYLIEDEIAFLERLLSFVHDEIKTNAV